MSRKRRESPHTNIKHKEGPRTTIFERLTHEESRRAVEEHKRKYGKMDTYSFAEHLVAEGYTESRVRMELKLKGIGANIRTADGLNRFIETSINIWRGIKEKKEG